MISNALLEGAVKEPQILSSNGVSAIAKDLLACRKYIASLKAPGEWETLPVTNLQELEVRLLQSLSRKRDLDSSWEAAEQQTLQWVLEQIHGKKKRVPE